MHFAKCPQYALVNTLKRSHHVSEMSDRRYFPRSTDQMVPHREKCLDGGGDERKITSLIFIREEHRIMQILSRKLYKTLQNHSFQMNIRC